MSKEQQADYLSYGQGILISGFTTGEEDQGYLTAKGFADTMAIYETYKDKLYFKNYRNALFEIVPAANFQLNDQLRRLRQIYNEDNANMQILAARSLSEAEQFDLQKKAKKGKQVCFGDLVIFKHADSDRYLSGTIEPSGGTNGAFLVEVTTELKEILIFRMLPFRSYEKIGMNIPFESPVQLQNVYNNGFLTYEKIGITPVDKKFDLDKKPIMADDSYVIPVKTKSSQSELYECVTHFMDLSKEPENQNSMPSPMPWRFQLHIKDIQDTESLIQHDIIYFQHTENNGILSTRGKEIILKEMKEQGGQELPFYECLWQVEKHEFGQDAYILRHLMSGMTLGIKKDADGNPIKAELFDISQGTAEGNLGFVDLRLAKKEIADIDSGSYVNICCDDWCLDKVKSQEVNEGEEEDEKSQDFISIPKLNKLAVNELQYEVKKVKFTIQISKNCFMIKEIEDQLKKQCLFALSFHAKIIDLRQDLKWGWEDSQQNIKYRRLMQVTEKIKQIKDFLKNCSKEQSDLEYIKPIYKRQMICKDLGISQLLFELLFYMKKNFENKYIKVPEGQSPPGYIFHNDPNSWGKFWQLYNVIYEVIYELVRDNLLFKIYVSKWINFVIQDVLTENEPNHLQLLKELFRSNQFLVKYFVDSTLIGKLASRMLNQKEQHKFVEIKYLQIFRLFCIVGDNINTGNQIILLQKFIKGLKKTPITEIYQITVSKQSVQNSNKKEIFTQATIDKQEAKKRRFNDYKKICKEEYNTAWAYFVQYLNLLADMTRGRNKLVEDYIKGMFSADILTDLMLDESLEQAEPSVVRLLHNLYIQSDPYYAIEKNKRILDYDALQNATIDVMNAQKTQPWKAQSLMKILNGILDKIRNQYGPINPSETLKNQCLYQYLSFLWQTLDLGFWEKKQHIKNILDEVLRILVPHPSVAADYEKASIESKENLLMMKCKQECMNIIQLILDYDLDLSVRSICQFFQKFQLPPRKRSLKVDEGTKLLEMRIDDELATKFVKELPQDESMNLVELSIIPQMIELSKYNNPRLTSGSISIIERVLLKSKKAIEAFCRQLFVCGDQRLELKRTIEEHKDKFYIMQDQTLVKIINEADQTDNYVAVYKEDLNPANAGIMQVINMMSQIIKNQVEVRQAKQYMSLQALGLTNLLGEETLINFTDERNSSNYMKQSVLDAENIHLKVLEFVLNCKEIPPDGSFSKKLLHLSYKFLVSLIWNNQHLKPTLIGYLPYIQHHLKKNVGSIDFLKEMYDNNKTLLFNQVNVRKLIKEICNAIDSQPLTSYYRSKLLDFFRFLIYCNGKSLKNNQVWILKQMQDDSYSNVTLNIDTAMIERLVRNYKGSYEAFEKKKVQIEPDLLYLITYFQIMESLIDDRCVVNMGKLKKRYPFEKLLEWLRRADTCWPLKRNIRAFLNRLYYFQPEIEVYMKEIVDKELDNIINDLNWYILIKCRSNIAQIQNFKFQNPIRFTYLQSYIYLNLEQNLFTLYKLATDPKISEQMKSVLHPVDAGQNTGPKNFIRICERLGWIKNYFTQKKNTYTNSFIKFLLNRFQAVITEFDDEIYLPGMELLSGQKRAPMKSEKEKARKGLIAKIMRGDIGTFFVQEDPAINNIKPLVYQVPNKISNPKEERKPNQNKLYKKLREILKRQKQQYKNQDQRVDASLSRLVRAIKLSKDSEELLTKEYNSKLNQACQGDAILSYITIIIEMNSKDRDALPVKAKRFFLNLITGIIDQTNSCPRDYKTIDMWEAEDWVESRNDINIIQNKLKLCKLGTFITELLKENIWQNVEFADAILYCGIAYLYGGYTNTQKDMIDTIKADKENRVMRNLEYLISKLGQFIVKNIEESSKKEVNDKDTFSITTIDNYDFYVTDERFVTRKNVFEPQTTDEEIYTLTCIRTYQRAFKFLQLLCENNNTDGKNFIRDQKNDLKNFDFIKIAAKEIRNIFLFLTPDICQVSLFLLDFILEVTYIPVKQNQDALLNLTFFEDVCSLHNSFYRKPDYVSLKGFDGKEEQQNLNAIFQKTILIILSCFEGNELKTFKAIDNKLEPKFLTNILTEKLEKMGLSTKEQAIEYIEKLTSFQFDTDMKAVLNIIVIFLKLKEMLGVEESRVYSIYKNERNKNPQLYQYLEKNLIQIQIINNGVEQLVIFPKYPVFKSLTGGLRDTVMNSVERTTHRDKIVSLLAYTSAVKSKIESTYTLLKEEKITEKHMNDAFSISAIMSIVICIFMMMYYDVIINYGEADFQAPRTTGLARFALSLVQLSMALVYAYYWLKFKIWQSPERKARVESQQVFENPDGQTSNKYVKVVKDTILEVSQKLRISQKLRELHEIVQGGDTTQPLYLSAQFWRVAVYVTVSFIGAFFFPPLYFIHIMDILCYHPEIGNIFKAIGLKFSELLYVSFMGVVFAFVFCTVTFSNYQKNVYSSGDSEEDLCQTMMECILTLNVSGAIGESMQSFQIVRFTYDTIYGIFFGTMLANIISGIMLDAFGSLRDQTNALQYDKDNMCYICNVTRQTLEKQKKSFKEHINGPHFLWNYVFYVYYLDKKSPTDYSGLQYFITNQYNKSEEDMQIDWVPVTVSQEFDTVGKLQELTGLVDEKATFLEEKTAEIEDSLKKLKEILGE